MTYFKVTSVPQGNSLHDFRSTQTTVPCEENSLSMIVTELGFDAGMTSCLVMCVKLQKHTHTLMYCLIRK